MRPLYLVALVLGLTAILSAVAFIVGLRWDAQRDTQQEINTIEGAKDAQDNAGDCTASWLDCLLKHRGD